jgi:hypothetical protein
MFERSIFQYMDRATPEERLWRAVIARTLEEWVRGPLRYSRMAEQFLFSDEQDFPAICSSAGMDPNRLRRRLKMIRARGIQKENSGPQTANPAATPRRRALNYLSPVQT